MVWSEYNVILKPLFLARSQYSSDANRPISRGDIHLTIHTFILLPSMEPASPVDRFSVIASQHNYVLLVGQPLTDLPHAAWFIPLHPVPSQPLVLSQRILLASPTSRTYFGQIKSITRLEKFYLVISVSPESSAYDPFIPLPCQVYLPTSFLILPPLSHLQYSMFASHLPDAILEQYHALNPTMEHS